MDNEDIKSTGTTIYTFTVNDRKIMLQAIGGVVTLLSGIAYAVIILTIGIPWMWSFVGAAAAVVGYIQFNDSRSQMRYVKAETAIVRGAFQLDLTYETDEPVYCLDVGDTHLGIDEDIYSKLSGGGTVVVEYYTRNGEPKTIKLFREAT
jgi:hypothetical protein